MPCEIFIIFHRGKMKNMSSKIDLLVEPWVIVREKQKRARKPGILRQAYIYQNTRITGH